MCCVYLLGWVAWVVVFRVDAKPVCTCCSMCEVNCQYKKIVTKRHKNPYSFSNEPLACGNGSYVPVCLPVSCRGQSEPQYVHKNTDLCCGTDTVIPTHRCKNHPIPVVVQTQSYRHKTVKPPISVVVLTQSYKHNAVKSPPRVGPVAPLTNAGSA